MTKVIKRIRKWENDKSTRCETIGNWNHPYRNIVHITFLVAKQFPHNYYILPSYRFQK